MNTDHLSNTMPKSMMTENGKGRMQEYVSVLHELGNKMEAAGEDYFANNPVERFAVLHIRHQCHQSMAYLNAKQDQLSSRIDKLGMSEVEVIKKEVLEMKSKVQEAKVMVSWIRQMEDLAYKITVGVVPKKFES